MNSMARRDGTRRCATWAAALGVALSQLSLRATVAHAGDDPVASIEISSAISRSSLGNSLVEGVMRFRGEEYLLTLRGVEGLDVGRAAVYDLLRAQDISGTYKASGVERELRNLSGVRLRIDTPVDLKSKEIEIELSNRRTPKISQGHRESGVE
jgi:hypothetical protein